MTDASEDDSKTKEFCAAVGELILWANMIDTQLNQAILGLFALPEHPVIEPIIAQLDIRSKAELLKKRAKFIRSEDWRKKIIAWVEKAEKANGKRNIVAHHGMRVKDGKIFLHSDQLGKIFDGLTNQNGKIFPKEKKGLSDILRWIDQAQEAYQQGQTLLDNLQHIRALALQ